MINARAVLAVLAVTLYVTLSGIVIFVHDLMHPFEVPWHFTWVLAASLFALPVGAAVFRIGTAEAVTSRLRIRWLGYVVLIVLAMEMAIVFELSFLSALPAVAALTAGAWMWR